MLTIFSIKTKIKQLITTVTIALLLSACGTSLLTNSSSILQQDANASSEFYLNRAEQAQNITEKQDFQLLAVRALLNENKIPQAEALFNLLTGQSLSKEQLTDKQLLQAKIAVLKGQNSVATSLLAQVPFEQLSNAQKTRYWQTISQLQTKNNNLIEAVRALIKADELILDTERKQQNINQIWTLLRSTNVGQLNATQPQGEVALAGWLELINTYNANISQPEQLNRVLQNWLNAYPSHSAAYMLPTELKDVLNYRQSQVKHIAVLLPLSGNAKPIGDIILKGFNDARGNSTVQVSTYDTMSGIAIPDLILQAKTNGADAVVGPLVKSNVDSVLNANTTGLKVLTLNNTANAQSTDNVCYYGLSPEAEARSAANKMWNDNIRTPLLVVPQNDLGQRTAAAFNLRWQQLSGTDAQTQFYNDSTEILSALQSGLITTVNNVNPAIYIVADNQELLEIKNAINNAGYTSQLALYASSRSNNPNNGPDYRVTMDGLKFSEIPLLSDPNNSNYTQVLNLTNGDYFMMRLYAMGADSWLLINKFNELRQIPGFSLNGLTGKLYSGSGCNIDRDMSWLEYRNGQIYIIN